MEADRIKWNNRFAAGDTFLGPGPSPFLAREIETVKSLLHGRRALDIACGEGRNSVFLASHGFSVTAIDISEVGLGKAAARAAASGVTVEFIQADLDKYVLTGCFDLVINFNFLQRRLIPVAVGLLPPGGLLLIDTILTPASVRADSCADYYLQSGELLRLFTPYGGEILYHEECSSGTMPTARLMFQKTAVNA